MAIINRFHIQRYKEILVDVPAGTVNDPGFSTFNLDSPNPEPNGTSDFLGVIKRSILIGEIYKNVVDTNPRRLRQDPIPIGVYQQLTEIEYNRLVQTGDIVENPQTNGNPQIIGWVELGESYPSFYYQSCPTGKQPRVDNYFDFNEIEPSLYLVRGEGVGITALEQVGNWNINETYDNWGITNPTFPPLMFQEYIRMSVGSTGLYGLPFLNNQRLTSIPLLIADRLEHFDRDATFILSPSFSDPFSLTPTDEKTVFARQRITIIDGFRPFTNEQKSIIGRCFDKIDTGGPSGPGPDIDTPDLGDDGIEDTEITQEGCFEPYPINLPPYDILNQDEIDSLNSFVTINSNELQDTIEVLRLNFQLEESLFNQRDPREPFLESYSGKNGIILVRKNDKNCTLDIYPALRDKDGNIPEPIGPAMSNYFKNTRKTIASLYAIQNNILQNIGTGSDGYEYYSDGNSYVELLGEGVLGCGDQISFGLDIPEVRSEAIINMEEKYFKKISSANLQTENVKQTITLHTMDLLYGIFSSEQYLPIEDPVFLRLINLSSPERQFKSVLEWQQSLGYNPIWVWQNVMYPIYDKLTANIPKNRYNGFVKSNGPSWASVEENKKSLISQTYKPQYGIIDNAISIESTDSLSVVSTPRVDIVPLTNWDWLLSKGVGAFTLNFTYKAGPNGITDTTNATTTFALGVNYLAITQLIVALTFKVYELLSEDTEDEIPLRDEPIERLDDRPTLVRKYESDGKGGFNDEVWISEEEERYRQTTRRLHKKGNVLLQSKTGLYQTTTLPCPVIFLGYSDDYYGVNSGARRANIEKLSKVEKIEQVCVKKKIKTTPTPFTPIDVSSAGPITLIGNQPAPIVPQPSPSTNVTSTQGTNFRLTVQNEYESIPFIKPRVKKYGRNPLLDVFYLNVVNPYTQTLSTGDNFPPSQTNRYSNERRWSNTNRIPFRSNRSHKNWHMWPELEYAEFPSIFPPNWQYLDQTNWDNKLKTTIIPLEDRWELKIDYIENKADKPYVILKDKTPILDLYFALMEMHVKGISWKEILQYVDTAVSCVQNNNYLNWRSEQKITIDNNKLEKLWRRVNARLEQIRKESNENIFVQEYDFGVINIQVDNNTQLSSHSNIGKVLIKNNSKSRFEVSRVYISDVVDDTKSFSENNIVLDIYDRPASAYINVIDYPSQVNPQQTPLDYSEITLDFNTFGTQGNFEYNCVLVVEGQLNGGSIRITSNIRVVTKTNRVVTTLDEIKSDILYVPGELNFGLVESDISDSEIQKWSALGLSIGTGSPNLKQLVITNHSELDAIRLDNIYLTNVSVTDYDGNPQVVENKDERFFYIMDTKPFLVFTNFIGKNIDYPYEFPSNSIILPSEDIRTSNSRVVYIALLPNNKGLQYSYTSDLILEYTVLPRQNINKFGNTGIRKQKIIQLRGFSY